MLYLRLVFTDVVQQLGRQDEFGTLVIKLGQLMSPLVEFARELTVDELQLDVGCGI